MLSISAVRQILRSLSITPATRCWTRGGVIEMEIAAAFVESSFAIPTRQLRLSPLFLSHCYSTRVGFCPFKNSPSGGLEGTRRTTIRAPQRILRGRMWNSLVRIS